MVQSIRATTSAACGTPLGSSQRQFPCAMFKGAKLGCLQRIGSLSPDWSRLVWGPNRPLGIQATSLGLKSHDASAVRGMAYFGLLGYR